MPERSENQRILDQALFRRPDDVFQYAFPHRKEIRRSFEIKVKNYDSRFMVTEKMIEEADGLSQVEIVRVCDDTVKESIINGTPVTEGEIIELLNERKDISCAREA